MKIKHLLLLALSAASFTGSTSGQVQSAGPILVNMDATSVASGTLTDIPNTGTLGGFWEARGGATASPLGTNLAGINSIWFDGSNDYLQLVDAVGGALVPPPKRVARCEQHRIHRGLGLQPNRGRGGNYV